MEGRRSQATESNLYCHQKSEKKKSMQIPVLIDWSPFSDHMPAHSSSNKSGWGIKSSVAEHSLSLQNKERVKESKICCTRGKKKPSGTGYH